MLLRIWFWILSDGFEDLILDAFRWISEFNFGDITMLLRIWFWIHSNGVEDLILDTFQWFSWFGFGYIPVLLWIWFWIHSEGVENLILDTFRWCWGFYFGCILLVLRICKLQSEYFISEFREMSHVWFIFCSSLFSNTIIFYFWVCTLRCIVLVYYLLRSYRTL